MTGWKSEEPREELDSLPSEGLPEKEFCAASPGLPRYEFLYIILSFGGIAAMTLTELSLPRP